MNIILMFIVQLKEECDAETVFEIIVHGGVEASIETVGLIQLSRKIKICVIVLFKIHLLWSYLYFLVI